MPEPQFFVCFCSVVTAARMNPCHVYRRRGSRRSHRWTTWHCHIIQMERWTVDTRRVVIGLQQQLANHCGENLKPVAGMDRPQVNPPHNHSQHWRHEEDNYRPTSVARYLENLVSRRCSSAALQTGSEVTATGLGQRARCLSLRWYRGGMSWNNELPWKRWQLRKRHGMWNADTLLSDSCRNGQTTSKSVTRVYTDTHTSTAVFWRGLVGCPVDFSPHLFWTRYMDKCCRFYPLPVIQAEVSRRWRELDVLMPNRESHPLTSCFLDWLTDWVKVLRPTRNKIGHFGDVPQVLDTYLLTYLQPRDPYGVHSFLIYQLISERADAAPFTWALWRHYSLLLTYHADKNGWWTVPCSGWPKWEAFQQVRKQEHITSGKAGYIQRGQKKCKN